MSINGFDFSLNEDGELNIDSENHDIAISKDDDLRVEQAFTRIKSISHGWFYDNIGADLESIVGKPINGNVSTGVEKITYALTFDGLYIDEDILIQTIINNAMQVTYNVYLRHFLDNRQREKSTLIKVHLDLIKGVKVKYGWE